MRLEKLVVTAFFATAALQAQAPELGQGWLAEFNLAARQTLQLAEAIPEDKYGWRPGDGVRSVSEVLMHITLGNFWLQGQAGGEMTGEAKKIMAGGEKLTGKAAVIDALKKSHQSARDAYAKVDRTQKRKFFNKDTTADNVFLRLLVHNHEHMGQMIAYARSLGVKPPWSN